MHKDSLFSWEGVGPHAAPGSSPRVFPGEIEYGVISGTNYCRIIAPPHRVEHCAAHSDDKHWAKLLLQVSGKAEFTHAGGSFALDSGMWCVYDPAAAYSIVNFGNVEQLVLLLARKRLSSPAVQLHQVVPAVMSRNCGTEAVATDLLLSLAGNLADADVSNLSGLDGALYALIRASIHGPVDRAGPCGLASPLRDRIFSFIAFHLEQPNLSIESIAVAAGCSKRQVHRLFLDSGTTCARYITDCRLERCRDELLDPGADERSITDIAFGWGFNSSAYFATAFRKRYDVTPRAMRKHRTQK